jgi:hypothetical protein
VNEERHGWTLPAAAGLAAVETTTLIAVLALRGSSAAPILIPFLAVKYPFCYLVLRRSPGALLGLLLWESAGVVTALTAPRTPGVLRVLELSLAIGVFALLAASVSLFPAVKLPEK